MWNFLEIPALAGMNPSTSSVRMGYVNWRFWLWPLWRAGDSLPPVNHFFSCIGLSAFTLQLSQHLLVHFSELMVNKVRHYALRLCVTVFISGPHGSELCLEFFHEGQGFPELSMILVWTKIIGHVHIKKRTAFYLGVEKSTNRVTIICQEKKTKQYTCSRQTVQMQKGFLLMNDSTKKSWNKHCWMQFLRLPFLFLLILNRLAHHWHAVRTLKRIFFFETGHKRDSYIVFKCFFRRSSMNSTICWDASSVLLRPQPEANGTVPRASDVQALSTIK